MDLRILNALHASKLFSFLDQPARRIVELAHPRDPITSTASSVLKAVLPASVFRPTTALSAIRDLP